jgi:very-short-patch-repair endonuclease
MRNTILRARRLRFHETTAESKLWHALRNRKLGGRKFRRQHPIGGYIVDLVCVDAKLIVEIDGATHSTDAELASDRRREAMLRAAGYEILRVTNAEIYAHIDFVLETILAALERRATW